MGRIIQLLPPATASPLSPPLLPNGRRVRDAMVTRRLRQSLDASGYGALKRIEARHHRGVAYLEGRVDTFYLKQVAQVLALSVNGVERVVNDVKVDI